MDQEPSSGGFVPDFGDNNEWKTEANFGADDEGFGKPVGDGFGEKSDDANRCRNCGEEGHFSRNCPEPKKMTGECYNCGETGHNKADCPNPKVARPFTGECRVCGREGHLAAECPDRLPCRICGQQGHKAIGCSSKRLDIFPEDLPACTASEAWVALQNADKEKDTTEFRNALLAYAKAILDITENISQDDMGEDKPNEEAGHRHGIDLVDIEKGLRDDKRNFYLIAKEREIPETLTIVGLDGSIDRKYMLTFSLSPNPLRKKFAEGWPSSAEDNLERLKSCGFPMDRLVPKCDNCGEMGHIRKHCKAEATEPTGRVTITCFNCNGTGHRARDCTEERVNHNLCRNCKQPGHKAADCPEPRSAEGVECRRCGEMGHYSRDCPNSEHKSMACHNCGEEGHKAADCDKPRVITCRNCGKEGHTARECEEPKNPANFTCRNCAKTGHFTRDCPEPKDWSKVQCRNCGEYGHTITRCSKPKDDSKGESSFDISDTFATADAGENSWEKSSFEPKAVEPTGNWESSGW